MSGEPIGDPVAGLILSTLQENKVLTKRLQTHRAAINGRSFVNVTPEFLARLETNMAGMRAIVDEALQENHTLLDAIDKLTEAVHELTLRLDQAEGKA